MSKLELLWNNFNYKEHYGYQIFLKTNATEPYTTQTFIFLLLRQKLSIFIMIININSLTYVFSPSSLHILNIILNSPSEGAPTAS